MSLTLPFATCVGPSSRQTGRFTAAENLGGSSLSFFAAAALLSGLVWIGQAWFLHDRP